MRQAIRTPHFWLLFAVYVFTGLGSFLVALHQLAFAVDIGFDKLYAAGVLGMGAFLSLPGVIVTGTLSDYVGREVSAVVTYGTSILGVVFALMITSPDQHLLLWLHACFFGLTWGARGPAITAKTADLFPGPQPGRDPGGDHHRHRARCGGRLLARRVRVRYHRQLPGRVRAVDFLLRLRQRRVLGAAAPACDPNLSILALGGTCKARESCDTTKRRQPMLFLVISEPRPERPSSVTAARQSYWRWIQPLIDAGEVRSVHAKVGRGAVVLFDVAFQ